MFEDREMTGIYAGGLGAGVMAYYLRTSRSVSPGWTLGLVLAAHYLAHQSVMSYFDSKAV